MAVYDPSGSNGVHMPQPISGKKSAEPKKAPSKKATPEKKTDPAKKAAPGKKALPPFMQPGKKKNDK
jgi:hypothetical protein